MNQIVSLVSFHLPLLLSDFVRTTSVAVHFDENVVRGTISTCSNLIQIYVEYTAFQSECLPLNIISNATGVCDQVPPVSGSRCYIGCKITVPFSVKDNFPVTIDLCGGPSTMFNVICGKFSGGTKEIILDIKL